MTTEIIEYSKTEAALSELASKYKGVIFDCSTREGMMTAVKGRAELRNYRVNLEKTRVEIKAPALRRTQLIDAEARRLAASLMDLEEPIDKQIKIEEARREFERTKVEREAKEKAEADERAKREAEEKRMVEERAEIECQRAELVKAEQQTRMKIEIEERAARQRLEDEERKARLAREEADRVSKIAREAEEAKLKAERQRIEGERRAAEEAERKLREEREAKATSERRAKEEQERQGREAEEAKQREILRKANEGKDASEMLLTFKKRFGHLQQFAKILKEIDIFLEKQ